jgi:uncharacterized protein DUF177 involved in 23S rRNA accumulation
MAAAPALNVLAWSLAMTRKTDTPTELAWEYATQSIPERGLSDERKASPEELAAIARALDLLACRSLSAAFTIMPTVGGRYHLTGTVRADVTQACVVTLDPVDSAIEEAFDVTFWPERDMPAPSGGALDIDEEADPEPIVAGQIAVGRVVFEHLAAAIDPFPRMPDAALERDTATGAAGAPGTSDSPFAVLANIKPRT